MTEYEDRARYRARRELAERKTEDVVPAVQKWVAGLDKADQLYEHNLLEANWVLQAHNVVDTDLLSAALNADDYHCRAAATTYRLRHAPQASQRSGTDQGQD